MSPRASALWVLFWAMPSLAAPRATELAVILPVEANQAREVIDSATLTGLNGSLPRAPSELADMVEAEVSLRLLRRFVAARGWLAELDAELQWQLTHSEYADLETRPFRRTHAIRRTLDAFAARAALRGVFTVAPNASGYSLRGGPFIAWGFVCITPRARNESLTAESLVTARAYLDELRSLDGGSPLSQRLPPFRTPLTALPSDVVIQSEPLRVNDPRAIDGGTTDERGMWLPRFANAEALGERFVDATWRGHPCLGEIFARCAADGCPVAQAQPILDRAAFERAAKYDAGSSLRRLLWWSAPVTFSPSIATAVRSMGAWYLHGVRSPRPEAVQVLFHARAHPTAAVWSLAEKGVTDSISGRALLADVDVEAPCNTLGIAGSCEEFAVKRALEHSRELLALKALARRMSVPERDVQLSAPSTGATSARLREALEARLMRMRPSASARDVKRAREEVSRFPHACEQVRRISIANDGGCSIESLRDAGAPSQLVDACDSLQIPETRWWCHQGVSLGTHFSTMVSCPPASSVQRVSEDSSTPLADATWAIVTLNAVRNCDADLPRQPIATEAELRAVQRQLHNERLKPAYEAEAAQAAAASELDRLLSKEVQRVMPGTSDIAAVVGDE